MPNIPYSTDYKHTRVVRKKNNKSYSAPAHVKLYKSRRWRNLRAMFVRYNPLCVACKENNIIKECSVVDHIIPVSEGGEFYKWKNLQSLCRTCHARKTAAEVNKRVKERKKKAHEQ